MINEFPTLTTCVLDLLFALDGQNIPLIIGGGFGLYLKRQNLPEDSATLLPATPEARSTNDLDIFLKTEIFADPHRVSTITEALNRLDYKGLPKGRDWQFVCKKEILGKEADVKIDFMAGPRHPSISPDAVRDDGWRIKPLKPKSGLHGRSTSEAVSLEDGLLEIPLCGLRSNGMEAAEKVFLPQVFTYLLMKLFAFRDGEERAGEVDREVEKREEWRGKARKHARDIYTILALTTEAEWEAAQELSRQNQQEAVTIEATKIVRRYFTDANGIGIIRIREEPGYSALMDLERLRVALSELFP